MKVYLDTSVVLAWYLEGDPILNSIPKVAEVGSSRLLWVETSRVLERALRDGSLGEGMMVDIQRSFVEMSVTMNRLRITEGILKRAEGSFPLVIKTLDALHLSSALTWLGDEDPRNMEIWTFDRRLNHCAGAMGFSVPLIEKSR